jgi:hypothetical protein
MNWRLGFFQIWVIVSVIWVTACGVYGYEQSRRSTFLITDTSGVKFAVRAPSITAQSDVQAFVQSSDTAKTHIVNCKMHTTAMCQSPLPLSMSENKFWLFFVTAIAGPLAGFLVGSLGFWIAARFTRLSA